MAECRKLLFQVAGLAAGRFLGLDQILQALAVQFEVTSSFGGFGQLQFLVQGGRAQAGAGGFLAHLVKRLDRLLQPGELRIRLDQEFDGVGHAF